MSPDDIEVTVELDDIAVTIDTQAIEVNVEPPDSNLNIDLAPDVIVLATGGVGPEGPMGPAGPAGASYTFIQTVAAYMWDIVHNLGVFPSITVVDSGGTVIIPDAHYVDSNQIQLYFQYPTSGKAYLN